MPLPHPLIDIVPLLKSPLSARSALFGPKHETAFRLFNGFSEGCPDLTIDLYARTLVLHDYSEPSGAAFHDSRGDVRKAGQLRCGDHAGRPGANDEHVNLLRELGRPVQTDAGCGLNPWVTGYVTVVVELHGLSSLHCGR